MTDIAASTSASQSGDDSGRTAHHGFVMPGQRTFNRELSWLAFNRRVMEEARNEAHPLLERLRFLSISGNNLDEFFMVRVAGIKAHQLQGIEERSQDGLTPTQQLAAITGASQRLVAEQQSEWHGLSRELASRGIEVVHELTGAAKHRAALQRHFRGSTAVHTHRPQGRLISFLSQENNPAAIGTQHISGDRQIQVSCHHDPALWLQGPRKHGNPFMMVDFAISAHADARNEVSSIRSKARISIAVGARDERARFSAGHRHLKEG